MDAINSLLIAIPALPLASAILTAVLGPRILKQYSHWLTIGALLAASVCSLLLVREVHTKIARADVRQPSDANQPTRGFEQIVTLWTWAAVADAYQQVRIPPGDSPRSPIEGGMRDLRVDISLRADGLTAMMLAMVTFVATWVAIFAAGYMHGDRGYWRFFAYFSLFVFSMTMLVSVSNFVLLYVFWEAVGVCSYLLIGFWYEKPEAAAAGKKAFLVNRVGDFGFAVAIFLIWTTYGTLNFHDTPAHGTSDSTVVADANGEAAAKSPGSPANPLVRGVLGTARLEANDYVGGGVGLAIALLLMLGACGKSAQFPLHVWLPDAMEGPTPVSALIHAATMVTAGVYMVARCTPLFMVSPTAQLVVACVGAFTALLAGIIALSQFDLKRVLAYSTVSQLGYMFLGLGTGTFAGITAGMFHLFTHAFFKALLFLGAGCVMHAMGQLIDMQRFGGLRRIMPTTHATFLIGCLALAGIPPFAGFWSKDAIVAAVEEKAHALAHAEAGAQLDHGQPTTNPVASHETTLSPEQRLRFANVYQGLYYVALVTVFLTAIYTFRAFYLTFYGPLRVPHEANDHAHEAPPVMWAPLVVLAVGAGVVGFVLDRTYLAQPAHDFADFIGTSPVLAQGAVAVTKQPFQFHLFVAGVSTVVALAGWLVSTYLYLGDRHELEWVTALLDFELPAKWLDVESVSRLKNLSWIAAIHRSAQRLGLGIVTAAIGQVFLLMILVLSTPFLLGRLVSPYKLSVGKFYFDEIYQLLIVLPLRFLADVCYAVDRWIVDGLVDSIAQIPPAVGSLMRSLQTGLVPFYALSMLLGALVLFAARLLWGG